MLAVASIMKLCDEAVVTTLHFKSIQENNIAISVFLPVSDLILRSSQFAILSAIEVVFDVSPRRLQTEPIDGIGATIHSLPI